MHIAVVSLFPALLEAFAATSVVRRAISSQLLQFRIEDLRNHGTGNYKSVDDTPYGGGSGMVLRVDCVVAGIEAAEAALAAPVKPLRVLLTPQGHPFTQSWAQRLRAAQALILVCGRYEGFDDRVRSFVDLELSLGDFVLAGGEVAAMAVIEATARLIPGVLGNRESTELESFSVKNRGLLEFPQFTRPLSYRDLSVPEVLRGGNHAEIQRWREQQALLRTRERRPDLVQGESVTGAIIEEPGAAEATGSSAAPDSSLPRRPA